MSEILEKKEKETITVAKEKSVCDINLVGVVCVDSKEPQIQICFRDFIQGENVEVFIPRSEMSPAALDKLISEKNGICLDPRAVCQNLLKKYNTHLVNGTMPVRFLHTKLGWDKKGDTLVFWGHKLISPDDSMVSEYGGGVDIKPCGNISEVSGMICDSICGGLDEWSALEAVIAFGAGSTVLPYINMAWEMSLNNILLHLLGGSTTGKSTALSLFTSLGCNPEAKHGFAISYVSTEGSIIKRIGHNNGYPVSIDEISAGNKKDYETLVYTIGNGEEKDRVKPGGIGLQDSATFQTVVLSSGEVSLLKKCSKNEGIRARCIEIANVQWTSSKEQSEKIIGCVKRNYGLVIPAIAQELMRNDKIWRERWEYWKKKVEEKIVEDEIRVSIGPRVASYVSLFTMSAEIVNEILNVKLNVKNIFNFCYEYIVIANAEEANIGGRAYSAILAYISLNKEKFADASFVGGARSGYDDVTLDASYSGFSHNVRKKQIGGNSYDMVYVFRENILENVLADAGFSDSKVVLHKLKELGYLKTNGKNSYRYYYTINGSSQPCYSIYFRDETMQGCDFDDGWINPFKTKDI